MPHCRECHTSYMRIRNMQSRYGLTEDKYNEMIEGGCDACGRTENLHVDHSHITGEVRGILCDRCNHALGHLADDPQRIMNLYDYIMRCTNG